MKFLLYLKRGLILLAVLVLFLLVALFVTTRGPHRGTSIDITFPEPGKWGQVNQLEVGVGVRDITPQIELYDSWVDQDGDGAFDPDIDQYEDKNGNGTFDLIWLAGFGNKRAAQGIHDPLWARAIAFKNNGAIIVLVSIDSIGITHDRYLDIRERLVEEAPHITHVSFAATHTHNAPDTIGLWSYKEFIGRKFDDGYIAYLQDQIFESILESVSQLVPAKTVLAEAEVPMENFTHDSRPPVVVDKKLPVALFRNQKTGETIATLSSWGMHPEGFGSDFPLISSDFVHYYREAMESGLDGKGGFKGFGGKAIYFTGPVGGLMTQLNINISDRFGEVNGPGSKSKAQGENLAILAAEALNASQKNGVEDMSFQGIAFTAKTIFIPIGWPLKVAVALGLVHPGMYGLPFNTEVKSEINAIRIGDLEIITSPGEVFPEIVDGGIESPAGADIITEPVEVPPLRSQMEGAINMNFNLGMDEIGYIIPISQWDREPPYTYSYREPPYGEIYIGDPSASPKIHRESLLLLERLHDTLSSAGNRR
ncbi:MAG: hypothetical protein ACJ0K4_09150 [Verrucomicrobiales bacterium]